MNNIICFFKSNLKESEFYDISKKDLITLKEYFEILKEKDREFKKENKEDIESIKNKLEWVKEVYYQGYNKDESKKYNNIYSSILLNSEDNIDIIPYFNYDTKKYEDIRNIVNPFCKYMIFNQDNLIINKRNKDLNLVQKELENIDRKGYKIYDGYINEVYSVSKSFKIFYKPQKYMNLSDFEDEYSVDYSVNGGIRSNKSLNLTLEENKKVLNNIQIIKR